MSEHMSINGAINYWHLPFDESGGVTYCNNCKETCERLTVEFHQGICGYWMLAKCPKCKKTIWSSELERKEVKNNEKCAICNSPTNHYDCEASGGSCLNGKMNYWCSKKCYKESDRLERKKIKHDALQKDGE